MTETLDRAAVDFRVSLGEVGGIVVHANGKVVNAFSSARDFVEWAEAQLSIYDPQRRQLEDDPMPTAITKVRDAKPNWGARLIKGRGGE